MEPEIKGLIFDLDNTLFRWGPRHQDFYAMTAARAALNLGVEEPLEAVTAELHGVTGESDVAQFAAQHGLPAKALVHEFNAVAGRMFATLSADPDYAEPLPGVADLLRQLAPIMPMAVMTHGPKVYAEPVLDHLGLGHIISPDLIFHIDHPAIDGRRKDRHIEVFTAVAARLGVPPGNIAIFDDVADNHFYPDQLNMHTILVNGGRQGPTPPHVREQTEDIRPVLRRLLKALP